MLHSNQQALVSSISFVYFSGGIDFCVKHLYGVFAFILADVKENKIYYARDTLGVRPIFVLENKDQTSGQLKITAAASEVKGLVAIRDSCPPGQTQIVPHPPGCFTEFDLLPNGSAQFVRCEKFHTIGAAPAYEVSTPPEGSATLGNVSSSYLLKHSKFSEASIQVIINWIISLDGCTNVTFELLVFQFDQKRASA